MTFTSPVVAVNSTRSAAFRLRRRSAATLDAWTHAPSFVGSPSGSSSWSAVVRGHQHRLHASAQVVRRCWNISCSSAATSRGDPRSPIRNGRSFAEQVVTPNLPDGFTAFDAYGQMEEPRNPSDSQGEDQGHCRSAAGHRSSGARHCGRQGRVPGTVSSAVGWHDRASDMRRLLRRSSAFVIAPTGDDRHNTICVCVTFATRRPSALVSRVSHTWVRLPRCSGVASAVSRAPSGPGRRNSSCSPASSYLVPRAGS